MGDTNYFQFRKAVSWYIFVSFFTVVEVRSRNFHGLVNKQVAKILHDCYTRQNVKRLSESNELHIS